MRILHTSDWHLGRVFHREPLLSEQALMVDRLVELAADQTVDLVVVAGDLFDRSLPPADAVELFGQAVRRLRDTGATVVAIAGNHDSHVRIGAYDPVLAEGISLRGDITRAATPVLVTPRTGEPVAVYLLPYLDPLLAGRVFADDEPAPDPAPEPDGDPDGDARAPRITHDAVTRRAVARIRSDRANRPGVRAVLVAHTFAAGGSTSESERSLSVGNIEQVALEAFAGLDYVALGHLHGAQAFADGRIAYSGTPLPYSFSEQDHTKSVRIVELAADGTPTAEVIELGVGRTLATLTGEIDVLLTDPAHAHAEGKRVRVILTDRDLPLQAMDRLRDRFPFTVELTHTPPGGPTADGSFVPRAGQVVSPLELLGAYWSAQTGGAPDADQHELLESALAAAMRSES
ncbi:MAG: exonuclease SbcCD subunit D [Actinobacteria bacterium]|nr:exonuclease SbcCD subunit D [Actinomycetota bacterium]